MQLEEPTASRALRSETINADFVVIGGGLAGTCTAITAARAGIKTALVQDRPVLGGNGSSEVRLWTLGATSHMYNNNRWAREGGVINEILLENLYRNPAGNALIFDTVILEKVVEEENLTLFLNTSAYELSKSDPDTIQSVKAFCSQNSTQYEFVAPLFCDASGDGIIGFLARAAFRMGAESEVEFGEKFTPSKEFGNLLGHTIYFYSKDMGFPVPFVPPSYALQDVSQILQHRGFHAKLQGCTLWWIEYGGTLDTIHDTEQIKWELWRVVYGLWNHVKNSGDYQDVENLTLEWVGTIPGKRESRRFEGDTMLIQQDIIEQRDHPDVVAHGGWALDLHPAEGVYSELAPCTHWQAKGIYGIPYRALYSRNIHNLFLAGRIISASHTAFGSTRVMATLAQAGQAVGEAAAICTEQGLRPRDISDENHLCELQRRLARCGQGMPRVKIEDSLDLARTATITASSEATIDTFADDGAPVEIAKAVGQLLPLPAGKTPRMTAMVDVESNTEIKAQLYYGHRPDGYTPEICVAEKTFTLKPGKNQKLAIEFDHLIDQPRYVFVIFRVQGEVKIHTSEDRLTGTMSVRNIGDQDAPPNIGVDSFEMWSPSRRPEGRNLALSFNPPLTPYVATQVTNGLDRPTCATNAWAASTEDQDAALTLTWDSPVELERIDLVFDGDWDHPLESVLKVHPERIVPFMQMDYDILDDADNVLVKVHGNHQPYATHLLQKRLRTQQLHLKLGRNAGAKVKSIFAVRCYATAMPR